MYIYEMFVWDYVNFLFMSMIKCIHTYKYMLNRPIKYMNFIILIYVTIIFYIFIHIIPFLPKLSFCIILMLILENNDFRI